MEKHPKEIMHDCLQLMLLPIARFCLRRSIRLQDFFETAKFAFIAVAAEEMERNNESISTSRISVMSGVHRKDVTRIYKHKGEHKQSLTLVSKVLGAWQQNPRYRTKGGKARTLSFGGDDSDFTQLVRSVSADLNPYTVLFELERTGTVKKTGKGLKLISRIYNPKGDLKKGYTLLSMDTEDLISAVDENLWSEQDIPNLHIKTEYNDVALEALPLIRQWFITEGSAFHQRARNFLSQFDRELNPKLQAQKGGARVVVAAFSLVESPTSPASAGEKM